MHRDIFRDRVGGVSIPFKKSRQKVTKIFEGKSLKHFAYEISDFSNGFLD